MQNMQSFAQDQQQTDYYSLFMKAASSNGLYVGIFKEQTVQTFLKILENAATNCFYQIQEYVNHNCPTNQHFQMLKTALQTIKNWDSKTLEEESKKIQKDYGSIDSIYKASIMIYVRDTFKHQNPGNNVKVPVPPFKEFFFSFLCALISDKFVSSLEYFKDSKVVERKITHMDALTATFDKCIRQNISIPGVTISKWHETYADTVHNTRKVSPATATDYDDIQPEDSVSNHPSPPMCDNFMAPQQSRGPVYPFSQDTSAFYPPHPYQPSQSRNQYESQSRSVPNLNCQATTTAPTALDFSQQVEQQIKNDSQNHSRSNNNSSNRLPTNLGKSPTQGLPPANHSRENINQNTFYSQAQRPIGMSTNSSNAQIPQQPVPLLRDNHGTSRHEHSHLFKTLPPQQHQSEQFRSTANQLTTQTQSQVLPTSKSAPLSQTQAHVQAHVSPNLPPKQPEPVLADTNRSVDSSFTTFQNVQLQTNPLATTKASPEINLQTQPTSRWSNSVNTNTAPIDNTTHHIANEKTLQFDQVLEKPKSPGKPQSMDVLQNTTTTTSKSLMDQDVKTITIHAPKQSVHKNPASNTRKIKDQESDLSTASEKPDSPPTKSSPVQQQEQPTIGAPTNPEQESNTEATQLVESKQQINDASENAQLNSIPFKEQQIPGDGYGAGFPDPNAFLDDPFFDSENEFYDDDDDYYSEYDDGDVLFDNDPPHAFYQYPQRTQGDATTQQD